MITKQNALDLWHTANSIREYTSDGQYVYHTHFLPVYQFKREDITQVATPMGHIQLVLLCDIDRPIDNEDFEFSNEKRLTCPHCAELIRTMKLDGV